MATIYSHPRNHEGKNWKLKSLRNISDRVQIGMYISVHYTFWDACGDVEATTTKPSLPLLRWSIDQPQSRDLHGCHGHETTTGHECRNILQKKVDTSFVMINNVICLLTNLPLKKKLKKWPIISFHSAASIAYGYRLIHTWAFRIWWWFFGDFGHSFLDFNLSPEFKS
jgi:hypothetical protein